MNRPSVLKMRPLAALLLVLAVMFGGALDAAACAPQSSSFEQIAIGDEPAPADDQTGDQTDNHAVCSHGNCHHCHHGAQPDRQSSGVAVETPPAAHFGVAVAPLSSAELLSFKEPPRA